MNDLSCWETKFKYCCYSKRLLAKLLLLNKKSKQKINILEIKKAIYYAKKYHGDQKRQSGEPYYSHPLQVAYRIADYIFETNILVTSILHDIIEDTNLTKNMIDCIFGSVIADQVENLTRIKADRKISSKEMVSLLWLQKKYNILLIKQFDRIHNMQTITAKSPEKIIEITKETLEVFVILASYFKMRSVEQELIKLCTATNKQNFLQEYCFPTLLENPELPFLTFQNDVVH